MFWTLKALIVSKTKFNFGMQNSSFCLFCISIDEFEYILIGKTENLILFFDNNNISW